ncbi:MAG: Hsp70 family protein [Synergistaceae bacterium]|jgi:molecular chaperone HscC|nr:Hsp70 family protein [Synergistaceae bacterium]
MEENPYENLVNGQMAIIGIDLGTTNSLAAVWKGARGALIPNSLGELLTPSVVSVDGDEILVGRAAKERLISHPSLTASSFKRFMGTKKVYSLGRKNFTPEELSSFVLRRLKEDAEVFLGSPVDEAVISVPAYFNDNQRSAAKRAGLLAGLKVERLINEPSAAALACRVQEEESSSERCLVFDFGGGTLDVSVVECFENVIEILAISGNNRLGGDDFDRIIIDCFCRETGLSLAALAPENAASLLAQAEQCKRLLSEDANGSATILLEEGGIFSFNLTNKKLVEAATPIFNEIAVVVRRALQDSETRPLQLDRVLLVGGSSNMLTVQKYLEGLLRTRLLKSGPPELLVARGVGIYAGIKERREDIRDLVLTDVCPFTLGVAVRNKEDPKRSFMSPIIERNNILPSSKTHRYFTASEYQTQIEIEVYQGESLYCDENLKLGSLTINVPSAPKGVEGVDVRFTYDINGILEVEVRSDVKTMRKLFVDEGNPMSQEEIERRLKELMALKIHPRDKEENRLLLARAERCYAETSGSLREQISLALRHFLRELGRQEERSTRNARERFAKFLDQVDWSRDQNAYFEDEG